jgi:hypothetical protein
MALSGQMPVSDWLERVWKEAHATYFNILFYSSSVFSCVALNFALSRQIVTFTEHSLFQLLGIWNPVLCWSEEHFWLGFQRLIKHEGTAAHFGE